MAPIRRASLGFSIGSACASKQPTAICSTISRHLENHQSGRRHRHRHGQMEPGQGGGLQYGLPQGSAADVPRCPMAQGL
jgi:hypothetical protein